MRNIQISLILLLRFLVFILVSYGLLYFSYKYFSPNYGQSDFFHYYKMVLHPLDFTVTESPFIYRQFSTVITSLIVKSGIYYNTEISYVQEGIKQNVFFGVESIRNCHCMNNVGQYKGCHSNHGGPHHYFSFHLLDWMACLIIKYMATIMAAKVTSSSAAEKLYFFSSHEPKRLPR